MQTMITHCPAVARKDCKAFTVWHNLAGEFIPKENLWMIVNAFWAPWNRVWSG